MFLVAILGFAAQSIAEFIASYPANAKTLRADATCEFFTVGSMIVCLVAECLPGSKQKRILELGAAGLSMGLLLGFSIATIEEAVTRLIDSDYSTENPNGWIVLTFALTALVVDIGAAAAYLCGYDIEKMETDGEENPLPLTSRGMQTPRVMNTPRTPRVTAVVDVETQGVEKVDASTEEEDIAASTQQNARSAMMQILADTLRSFTILAQAIIILTMDISLTTAGKVDAYCVIIVCSTIILGVMFGVRGWMLAVHDFWRTEREEASEHHTGIGVEVTRNEASAEPTAVQV